VARAGRAGDRVAVVSDEVEHYIDCEGTGCPGHGPHLVKLCPMCGQSFFTCDGLMLDHKRYDLIRSRP
jgi:hypothetical protein